MHARRIDDVERQLRVDGRQVIGRESSWHVAAVLACADIAGVAQVQPGAGVIEPGGFLDAEHAVHPLHGAARRALDQVVDHAHHGDRCGRC